MPNDNIGVIVLVIGDHTASLRDVISYNIYERMLGMDQTPWSQRRLEQRLAGKKAGTEGRAKAGGYQPGAGLSLLIPGQPPLKLIPVKGLQFRTPRFADDTYEFVLENDQVKSIKERDPSGEYSYPHQ